MVPKKLFHGERIEAREYVKGGFDARVDLFETPEDVLKFIQTPCDIYQINSGKLIRKKLFVENHPFCKFYSYYEHISGSSILSRTTYR